MGWVVALFLAVALGALWWRLRAGEAAWREERAQLSTGHEKQRQELASEAANLRAILASMTEGVMLVDRAHIVRMANHSLSELLELRADPTGQSVLHGVREIGFEEIVAGTIESGQASESEVALAHVKPARHLAVEAMPVRDAAGEFAVLVICRDVTRLKQLEDVRREFVANVSHELRTPLAIFQGYLENLMDQPDMERGDLLEILGILKRHSTRLNALVEDLLDLARLESRSESLRPERIDPHGLVENIAADWRLHARGKDIRFTTECAENVPSVEADPSRIEQVLNNLVENAIKYTEAGGTVSLRIAPCAEGIELRVEDTGLGIPPQDLPHIFERFYRADKARTREQGGTGLGLSIVKHIVQLHGGMIRAESTYGRGTTVVVTLPVSPAQPRREVQPRVDAREHEAEPHLIE